MFASIFNLGAVPEQLTLTAVVVNLALSFVLSLIIAIVYRNTHKGLSYSQSFTFTLVLIGVLLSVIMMVVGNSLARAFGAFGAFSLIRFRTAIKDTRDLAFVLLVVCLGLAVGTGNYLIAILTTLFSVAIIYLLYKINFGSIRKYDYVLTFSAASEKFSNEKMREVYLAYLKYNYLLNVSSRENGKILDYTFNIKFLAEDEIEKFINQLSRLDGVSNIDVISAKNDIEY